MAEKCDHFSVFWEKKIWLCFHLQRITQVSFLQISISNTRQHFQSILYDEVYKNCQVLKFQMWWYRPMELDSKFTVRLIFRIWCGRVVIIHYSLFYGDNSKISCEQKNYLPNDKIRRNAILRRYGSFLGPFLSDICRVVCVDLDEARRSAKITK